MNFVQALFLSALLFAAPVYAQTAQSGGGPKSDTGFVSEDYEASTVDANGVDMISGSVRISADLLTIGPEGQSLSYSVITPSLAQAGVANSVTLTANGLPMDVLGTPVWKYDSYSGGVSISGQDDCNNWFQYGGSRADFCGTIAGGLVAKDGSSATLTYTSGEYIFTSAEGVKYYASNNAFANRRTSYQEGMNKIVYPSGYEINIYRGLVNNVGIVSVLDNRGYQIRITGLQSNSTSSEVKAFNMAVDYCAPLASTCTFTKSWPTATVTMGSSTQASIATDMTGRTTKLYPKALSGTFSGMYQFYAVKPAASEESAKITYTFCGPWGRTDCGGYGTMPTLGACSSNNPPTAEQCKQYNMVLNKVRTATKFGTEWDYSFAFAEL